MFALARDKSLPSNKNENSASAETAIWLPNTSPQIQRTRPPTTNRLRLSTMATEDKTLDIARRELAQNMKALQGAPSLVARVGEGDKFDLSDADTSTRMLQLHHDIVSSICSISVFLELCSCRSYDLSSHTFKVSTQLPVCVE